MESEAAIVMSGAVRRCASELNLSGEALAAALDISIDDAVALLNGLRHVSESGTEWGHACELVELYRRLTAYWGGREAATAWMRSTNCAFADAPLSVLVAPGGLQRLSAYVQAMVDPPFS